MDTSMSPSTGKASSAWCRYNAAHHTGPVDQPFAMAAAIPGLRDLITMLVIWTSGNHSVAQQPAERDGDYPPTEQETRA